jgi:hypothetical protein
VAPGVLVNDSGDMDGDPVTAILVDNVTNGTLLFNPDGTFTYTPNAGYVGSDSFTYKLNDGLADSNIATVTIYVTNSAPVFTSSLSFMIDESIETGDIVGIVSASDSDGDTVTFAFAGGSLTDPTGTFAIDPNTGVITVANADNIARADDYPNGLYFTFDVEVTDNIAAPTTETGTVSVNTSTDYFIVRPTEGAQIASTQDVKFEGSRSPCKTVKVILLKKQNDGSYSEIADIEIGGTEQKAGYVKHNFGKLSEGDYKIIYYKKKLNNSLESVGEVEFKVTP